MDYITSFIKSNSLGKTLLLLITSILTILLSMKTLFTVLIILITIDMLTGISKSFYFRWKQPKEKRVKWARVIKSKLLKQTGKKLVEYGVLIFILSLLDYSIFEASAMFTLGDKSFSLTELSIIFPIGIETWSIWENLEDMGFTNLFKKITNLLPDNVQRIFNKEKQIEEGEIDE